MNQVLAPNAPQPMNQVLAPNAPQPMNQVLAPNAPQPMNQVLAPNAPQPMNQVLAPNAPQPMNQVLAPNSTISPSTLYMTPITSAPNTSQPINNTLTDLHQKLDEYKKNTASPNSISDETRFNVLKALSESIPKLPLEQLTKEQKSQFLDDIILLATELTNFTSSNANRSLRTPLKGFMPSLENVKLKLISG
jgi:hypothetical protein